MKAKPETMRKKIIKRAEELGLKCEAKSPGDTRMRYKFYRGEMDVEGPIFIATGAREARIFLCGYAYGKEGKNNE